MKILKRLLITGANGKLGSICRTRLRHLADIIRVSSQNNLCETNNNEEIFHCSLEDKGAVEKLVKGVDGIIHLAAHTEEANWETIKKSNIDGMFNLYEGVRKTSAYPRIVFASSNHTTGFYKQTDLLNAYTSPKPDGLYGLSKAFGEALASLYYHKFGIETANIRIGSCVVKPINKRMLSTWLSHDDLIQLIERIFMVDKLGNPTIYGVSNNDASWWDNSEVSYLGWKPKDNANVFCNKIDTDLDKSIKNRLSEIYQGGLLCDDVIHEE